MGWSSQWSPSRNQPIQTIGMEESDCSRRPPHHRRRLPSKEESSCIIMQSASKRVVSSACTLPVVSQLQGWEDLPNELLHSIVALLCSFRDLLAFAATNSSWRAAFSSYPSKSIFCSVCPPLLVQLRGNDPHNLQTCKIIDPANQHATLCCPLSQEALDYTEHLVGSSYGQFICYHGGYCRVIDVFTGAEVSPPRLPVSDDTDEFELYCSGILTAPLASPNSYLLIITPGSLYDWPIGSDSWSELRFSVQLKQIVQCNGQLFAMDSSSMVYTLQLAPEPVLQKIRAKLLNKLKCFCQLECLVVCGEMLVMIVVYNAYRLDMLTEPAQWVEVKLDNWALFEVGNMKSPVFSYMSPERWGGRSSCLYYARDSQPWTVIGLGDKGDRNVKYHREWFCQLEATWVYPSMFCVDGQ